MAEGEELREQAAAARRLGGALRALQQRSGCTLRSLETRVRISDSSLSRYFRGDTVPPWATVRDLCRALEADPAEYRALWEAADRNQKSAQPGGASVLESQPLAASSPGASGVSGAPTSPGAWRAHLAGRWIWAAAGTLAGMLLGGALTALVLRADVPSPEGSPAPPDAVAPVNPAASVRMFRNKAMNTCLDDSAMGLRLFLCNGQNFQKWNVRALDHGLRELRNQATGACLDGSGTELRALTCDTSKFQKWSLTTSADDSAEVVRNQGTGACLDGSGEGLRVISCDGRHHQKWA